MLSLACCMKMFSAKAIWRTQRYFNCVAPTVATTILSVCARRKSIRSRQPLTHDGHDFPIHFTILFCSLALCIKTVFLGEGALRYTTIFQVCRVNGWRAEALNFSCILHQNHFYLTFCLKTVFSAYAIWGTQRYFKSVASTVDAIVLRVCARRVNTVASTVDARRFWFSCWFYIKFVFLVHFASNTIFSAKSIWGT